jgi:hypothetical protein
VNFIGRRRRILELVNIYNAYMINHPSRQTKYGRKGNYRFPIKTHQ